MICRHVLRQPMYLPSRLTIRSNSARLFSSSFKVLNKKNSDKPDGKGKNKELITKQPLNSDLEKFSPDLSSKVSKPTGGLPAIDAKLSDLMQEPNFQYDPKNNKLETSYEFHAPKSPSQTKNDQIKENHNKSRFKTMLPSLLVGVAIVWGFFTYDYLRENPNKDTDTELLRDDKFLSYLITFKHKIDDDHYLIELTRKNKGRSFTPYGKLFDGKKLWSIEIMQPDINIVRNYTPLPLYVAGVSPDTKEPHLKLITKSEEEGKFVIVVKRYNTGEFSRWLTNLNLLDEVKIRGPHTEHKIPFHPLDKYQDRPQLSSLLSNIEPDPIYPEEIPKPESFNFYGAGTGVMPLLQLLYSPNPPKGFIHAFISLEKESNLMDQFKTLNYFAEKCGRVKFTYLVSENNERLTPEYINKPTLPNFTGILDMKVSEAAHREKLLAQKKREIKNQIQGGGGTSSPSQVDEIDHLSQKPVIYNGLELIPKIQVSMKPDAKPKRFFFFNKGDDLPQPSFTFICGPENYISYISGKPQLNNLEGKDYGEIGGLLKDKGWGLYNIKRLL
ncbi:hypothetical protein CANARDRAFT_30588 [[Candida] arabinofermentans NRRL YB-2248]|uniref:Flavoprotein pyridine nucleotide cytochrome reductase-like FAD-binding domain-containing protein n=1 Tax=[Candida] arabinofermentans NRRL YB-2248 TaxID=983967 RepID=A0A1E4ST97_9ASCO|nr:hypothetical protein CANARDRAFT_30588 [[Candida] arabinofermentans NRRL YB-2248]